MVSVGYSHSAQLLFNTMQIPMLQRLYLLLDNLTCWGRCMPTKFQHGVGHTSSTVTLLLIIIHDHLTLFEKQHVQSHEQATGSHVGWQSFSYPTQLPKEATHPRSFGVGNRAGWLSIGLVGLASDLIRFERTSYFNNRQIRPHDTQIIACLLPYGCTLLTWGSRAGSKIAGRYSLK